MWVCFLVLAATLCCRRPLSVHLPPTSFPHTLFLQPRDLKWDANARASAQAAVARALDAQRRAAAVGDAGGEGEQ